MVIKDYHFDTKMGVLSHMRAKRPPPDIMPRHSDQIRVEPLFMITPILFKLKYDLHKIVLGFTLINNRTEICLMQIFDLF